MKTGSKGEGKAAEASTAAATSKGGSAAAAVACPMCGRAMHAATVAIHAATCEGAAETPPPPKRERVDQVDEVEVVTVEEEQPAKTNAFAAMMAAASRRETFEWHADDGAPVPRATWVVSTAKPPLKPHPSIRKTVTIGRRAESRDVDIVRSVPPSPATTTTTTLECAHASRLSVGVLKSIMQKAFRRRNVDVVRRAACELAAKSWRDLIRRVPIVLIEDGMLHPALDVVTWLLMADQAGLAPSQSDALLVVGVLCSAAAGSIKDVAWSDAAAMRYTREENESTLVQCLLARAEFGGMQGDVEMCRQAATVWRERFQTHKGLLDALNAHFPPVRDCVPTRLEGFAVPGVSDWAADPAVLAGVDTHCQPRLFDDVEASLARANAGIRLQPGDVASAMWHCCGGLNYRMQWAGPASAFKRVLEDRAASEARAREAREAADLCESGRVVSGGGGRGSDDHVAAVWRAARGECEQRRKAFLQRSM